MKGKLLIPLLSLTCAVTCSFGLTACGGSSDNGDTPPEVETPARIP